MKFIVRAIQPNGALVTLDLDANDAADAKVQVRARGLTALSISGEHRRLLAIKGRAHSFDLVLFSQELLALLQAGINIVEALETLLEKEQRPYPRQILGSVVRHLQHGEPLSKAMERLPETFPPLFIATIRASERTSNLEHGLGRYIAYAEEINRVRDKVVSASIYPVLLIGAGGLVMVFLLGYVVPRFGRIYADLGNNLPFMSRVLMHWGQLVDSHGVIMMIGLVALGFAGYQTLAVPTFRQRALERIWRIPAVGKRLHIYQLARFYRTLGMLLRGGIPVTSALDMVSGLLKTAYQDKLVGALANVREGQALSVAFERHHLTTPVALRMLRVGERGGNMGDMMDRIADFYDTEFSRWIEGFTRLFEPLLMAVIGLVIGIVVVLMYMPIFELAGSLR